MIRVVALWTAFQVNEVDILHLLINLKSLSLKEAGCKRYDFFCDPFEKRKFILFEEYENMEALELHRNSAHFKKLVVNQALPKLEQRAVYSFEQN